MSCDFCARQFDELARCRCFHFFCDDCASVGCSDDPHFTVCDFCPRCSKECEIKNYHAALGLADSLNAEASPLENKLQLPPTEFQCPITRDLMDDPVVLTDGFSYERAAIVEWMKSKTISPMTGMPVVGSIVPNTVLRVMINDWKQLNGVV